MVIVEFGRLSFDVLWRTVDDYHPLAVGPEHVRPIGEHLVAAIAAEDYVLLGREFAVDKDRVVAFSAREHVHCGVAPVSAPQQVVTFLAHYVVGA